MLSHHYHLQQAQHRAYAEMELTAMRADQQNRITAVTNAVLNPPNVHQSRPVSNRPESRAAQSIFANLRNPANGFHQQNGAGGGGGGGSGGSGTFSVRVNPLLSQLSSQNPANNPNYLQQALNNNNNHPVYGADFYNQRAPAPHLPITQANNIHLGQVSAQTYNNQNRPVPVPRRPPNPN
jgi:hypothetical protein